MARILLNLALLMALTTNARPALAAPDAVQPSPAEAADWWRGYEAAPQVLLPDGRRLRLFCTGTGSPTIMLEAGLGDGAWTWRGLQPILSRTYRTCSYDRAGYGGSDPGPSPRDIDTLAADLSSLLKAGHIPGPYIFVGHSLGGQIVRQFAYRHPGTAAGIVLVDPAADHAFEAYAALDPEMTRLQREAYAPAVHCAELAERDAVTLDTAEGRACMPPPPPELPRDLLHFHEDYAKSPIHYRTTLAELEAGLNGTDTKEADTARHPLGALPMIVLTADGNLDNPAFKPAIRKQAGALWLGWHEDMARLSALGKHRVIRQTSHYIQNDQPQAVLTAIAEVVAAAGSSSPR
jgi:pimeloyl-ACP methyl ester carboxylesterase